MQSGRMHCCWIKWYFTYGKDVMIQEKGEQKQNN